MGRIQKYVFPVVGIGNANYLALSQKIGTANENKEEAGMAHLLEHMQMSYDFDRSTNFECFASTNFYSTTYYFNVDLCEFDIVVEIIKNIIQGTYLNEKNMNRAKREILEEFKVYNEKNRNSDFRYLLETIKYEEKLPIGKVSLIEKFRIEDVKEFFQRNYSVQKMCLIWVVDEETLKKKETQWIDKINGSNKEIEEILIPYNCNFKQAIRINRGKAGITYYFYIEREGNSLDEILLTAIEQCLADCFQIDVEISKVLLSSKDEFIRIYVKDNDDIDLFDFLTQIDENVIQKKYKELLEKEIIGYNCDKVRQHLVNCFIFDIPIEYKEDCNIKENYKRIQEVFKDSTIKEIKL